MTKLIILLLVALLMVTIIYGNINIIENLLETEDINDYITCETGTCDNNKSSTQVNNSIPNKIYNSTHDKIMKNHQDIIEMRKEITKDLIELNKGEKSVYAEEKLEYERTLYGTLLLTILATCIIYYIFIHL